MLKCDTKHLRRQFVAWLIALAAMFLTIPGAVANPTVIGVDGTTIAKNLPIIEGALALNHGMLLGLAGTQDNVKVINYPQSFGLFTLSPIGYDKSVAIGVAGLVNEIKMAQSNPDMLIKVACLSQGSDVCTQANDQLRNEGYNQSNVEYFLEGNVDNAYLGMKVWIPRLGKNGVFVPGPGVTLGAATPTSGSDAKINQVSYEYDGFARTPEYPINLLADLNAVVGTLLEHGSYSRANPFASDNIVSTTPDGKITNIVIPVNEVPLLTVAKFFGLPQPVADIINPTLKAIIDTAYSPIPVGPGNYPTDAVTVKLLPSKEKFLTDIQNVKKGMQESGEKLASLLEPIHRPVVSGTTQKTRVTKPVARVKSPSVQSSRGSRRPAVSSKPQNRVNANATSKVAEAHYGPTNKHNNKRSKHSASRS